MVVDECGGLWDMHAAGSFAMPRAQSKAGLALRSLGDSQASSRTGLTTSAYVCAGGGDYYYGRSARAR